MFPQPLLVERCKEQGASIEFGDDIAALFNIVERLQEEQGMTLIHPFEGEHTATGTGTVGLELCTDVSDLDAVLVPVGGGGLIAGVSAAVKAMQPECLVYGVEPEGAAGMSMSLAAGKPVDSVTVNTIADSLGAPMHTPYAYSVVSQCVDEVLQVSDTDIIVGMKRLFTDMKLAVEPACAAAMAALVKHPKNFHGKRVAIIACGSNIDYQSYHSLITSEL
jgi:threonine dehydratase